MSKEEKFYSLKSFILDHLDDYFNNQYSFILNDRNILCKLECIYNETDYDEPKIIFREIGTNNSIELKANNMPDSMRSVNHNEDIF